MYDESAGVDPFGHKKLAGAGKYIAQELKKLLAADDEIKNFMKDQGMYVEGLYLLPEIRTIVPSHLVRSGSTSAYDANFGMEAGAGAVMLLINGVTGVTVTGLANNTVHYMEIEKAISQRHVDLNKVALYEQLGFCFGRVRTEYNPTCKKENRAVERIY